MAEKPPTILIVDDTEASRYAVRRILQQAHFTVREAATGADALRLAAEKPDLVILDVNLPDMSGHEVCRRIKATPATSSTLVLHLSASFAESESRSRGLEMGADGYLVYPLEPRELLANVEALLRIRRAERAVREERELLRITLSSISDAVVATNAGGEITFINPVAQELTGWGESEALGRPLDDVFRIFNEQTGEPVESPAARLVRAGGVTNQANHTVLAARDGTRRPIDNSAAPIRDEEGRFIGVVLVFRDISQRRRLEQEIQHRSEDLAERDRRKDEFLAMLAHELRNPLAPICNSIQLLKKQFGGHPGFDQAGGVLERQTAHLTRLVDDLMDVARITRGKFELRKERVDLAAAMRRSVEAVRSLLDERQHRLKLSLPPETVALTADPARLEQVLCNLLSNAARYTAVGGNIHLSARQEEGEVVIRVEDNGIGIRADMLPHIFDLFQQADRVPGRVAEGLGIGLGLVRQLVEMHGGVVSASSPGAGQGSAFVVRLPLLQEATAPAQVAALEKVTAGRPLRVLITDDNVDAADSLAILLRLSGHEVRTAYDGPQALEVAGAFCPQVVFLDVGLPKGMDGYEVARRMRRQECMAGALLVAMTGFGSVEDVERARAAGMDHHLTKPADLAVVQRLLGSRA